VGQTTPIDFQGGAVSNTTYDPSNFRILYAGTGALNLTGGTTTVAVVYAPAANALIAGNSDFYGSVLSSSSTLREDPESTMTGGSAVTSSASGPA